MEKYLTCEEVATRYNIAPYTVRVWIRQKKLPAIKFGQTYRFRPQDLDALDREQSTKKTN